MKSDGRQACRARTPTHKAQLHIYIWVISSHPPPRSHTLMHGVSAGRVETLGTPPTPSRKYQVKSQIGPEERSLVRTTRALITVIIKQYTETELKEQVSVKVFDRFEPFLACLLLIGLRVRVGLT